jgi:hypothetical protein
LALLKSANACSSSPSETTWPTPTERDHRSVCASPATRAKNSRPLSEIAGMWPTPTERDHRTPNSPDSQARRNVGHNVARGQQLPNYVEGIWATPTVADTEGGRLSRSGPRAGELLLRGQARELHSRLDPPTTEVGATSSSSGLILNPSFVEHLMNWPPDFTLLAVSDSDASRTGSTACGSSEMAWSRWKRRMRSELSRFDLLPTTPPQLDLFG